MNSVEVYQVLGDALGPRLDEQLAEGLHGLHPHGIMQGSALQLKQADKKKIKEIARNRVFRNYS